MFDNREYERLNSIQTQLGISREDLYYAIESGMLKSSIWLPLRNVDRVVMKNNKLFYEKHELKEGFVGLRPVDTREIFSKGSSHIRVFHSINKDEHILRLSYEPPQACIHVHIRDLVILNSHKQEFLIKNGISEEDLNISSETNNKPIKKDFIASPDYRHVTFKGKELHFGDIQAKIIEILYNASQSNNPWVHGKTLLYDSGSRSESVKNIFQSKIHWRELIMSDGGGYYRINL